MQSALTLRRVLRRCTAFVAASAILASLSWTSVVAAPGDDKEKKGKGPSVNLKANPPMSFSPARVTVTAELRGGADTDEELYCPGLEWDWGDGTISEAKEDCEPFEAGKSTVKRRWISTHTFETAGNYRILLRLKRGSKSVVSGNTTVQVKPGARDMSEYPQP